MADPKAVVPYHDPHDTDIAVLNDSMLLDFSDEMNVTMDDLLKPASAGSHSDINFSVLNPSNDPYVQEILNDFINNPICDIPAPDTSVSGAGGGQIDIVQPDGFSYTEPRPPLMAHNAPFSCESCAVLGEMVHTDGNEVAKVEIHGLLGMVDHAVLQLFTKAYSPPTSEFVDFCHMDSESVKRSLEAYCEDRRLAGFVLVEGPTSVSHSSLDAHQNMQVADNPAHQFPVNVVERFEVAPLQQQQQEYVNAAILNKTTLALQRERSSRMTLNDFVDYFHLPIEKAAKELGVCTTVVKKICRKHGLGRWPHRKIKSLKRQVDTLKHNLRNVTESRDRARIQRDIDRTVHQIDNIRREAAAGRL